MSYRDYGSKLPPGWMQTPGALPVTQEIGGELDVQLDRSRQGVLANFPDQGPADALPAIGADRVLPQGVGESTADYRERLRTAWDSPAGWSFAGSHPALLFALQRLGLPQGTPTGTHIIQRTKRYTYLSSGVPVFATHSGWTFDVSPRSTWNQFGILIGQDVPALTVGSPLALAIGALVSPRVTSWKPTKGRFMGIWIFVSGFAWGWPLTAKWGDGGRTWGGVVRFIPPV